MLLTKEKRKYVRVKSNLKLFVSDVDGVNHRTDTSARIINFSARGICFESKINFHIGENCFLEFYLYNQKIPIKTVGTVTWKLSNPYIYTYGTNLSRLRLLDKLALRKSVYLYTPKSIYEDKSLLFWEIMFVIVLMYVLTKFCVLLPLSFTLGLITIILFAFYFWVLIYGLMK